MEIRTAGHGDLDDVTRLLAAFRDHLESATPPAQTIRATVRTLLDDPGTEYLLAVVDGQTVGVAQVRYRLSIWSGTEDCWLEDLFVDEPARGRGAGRALVEAVGARARARGCRRVELDVNEVNAPALALYTSVGFTTEPKPPGRTLFVSWRL